MVRVTKYLQSCVVLDRGDSRVAFDLGTRPEGPYELDALGTLDGVLYTHRHGDHLDVDLVEGLLERGIPLYANADVCDALAGRPVTPVDSGQELTVGTFTIRALDLPHFVMIDGTSGPQNTGFLVDDRFFHPGDGLQIDGVTPEVLAVPLAGPSISMHDAYQMVQRLHPETVIPIHYDVFPANPDRFAQACSLARVVVLGDGETADLG